MDGELQQLYAFIDTFAHDGPPSYHAVAFWLARWARIDGVAELGEVSALPLADSLRPVCPQNAVEWVMQESGDACELRAQCLPWQAFVAVARMCRLRIADGGQQTPLVTCLIGTMQCALRAALQLWTQFANVDAVYLESPSFMRFAELLASEGIVPVEYIRRCHDLHFQAMVRSATYSAVRDAEDVLGTARCTIADGTPHAALCDQMVHELQAHLAHARLHLALALRRHEHNGWDDVLPLVGLHI
jgi:hypothetical protein